jgi:hypothetical protein
MDFFDGLENARYASGLFMRPLISFTSLPICC